MNQTKLLLGNEAVARGLYEAGCRFVSSYPGTPSTEITEYAAGYALYAEWAPNEKVAAEGAIGASLAGARAFSGMKHVGLNVAADPMFTAAYTGVNGGLVVAVADDPGMHSSQNEQDSRHYARAAKLPMLAPSDSAECLAYTKEAFDLSERFDTPVLLGLSTRVSHSRSAAALSEPVQVSLKPYVKDPSKYVMTPAMARGRHVLVEKRLGALRAWAEETPLNCVEWNGDRKIGVIAGGIAYQAAREALGDSVSYLKLGVIWPLPDNLLKTFAAGVETLYVIEELDDFIEGYCRALGLTVKGKALFSPLGEYTPAMIRKAVSGSPEDSETVNSQLSALNSQLPVRPPVLCPGCPHRGLFYVLNRLKLTVTGDIGCYTLAASPPLGAMDLCVCMGASVSSLHGFVTARPELASRTVAVIGDSTFYHSGITGLVNIVYNQSPSTVLILDNAITGMTGHQQNPGTGLTLQNKPAPKTDLEALCRGVGVQRVRVVDPFDLKTLEQVLKEELEAKEPSVVIARRPCVLLPYVKKETKYHIDSEACSKCRMCMRIGCPAIRADGEGLEIDPSLCVGCGLCERVCKFGALRAADGIMMMNNPYKECPVLETDHFILRLVKLEDAKDLLECYSDPKAQQLFNANNCTSDFCYQTTKEMRNCIDLWLKAYEQEAYVRFAIVAKSLNRAVGTIEMFGMVGQYKTPQGVLRLDICSEYEQPAFLKELLALCVKDFFVLFGADQIITKASSIASDRIQVLSELGFLPCETPGRECSWILDKLR